MHLATLGERVGCKKICDCELRIVRQTSGVLQSANFSRSKKSHYVSRVRSPAISHKSLKLCVKRGRYSYLHRNRLHGEWLTPTFWFVDFGQLKGLLKGP